MALPVIAAAAGAASRVAGATAARTTATEAARNTALQEALAVKRKQGRAAPTNSSRLTEYLMRRAPAANDDREAAANDDAELAEEQQAAAGEMLRMAQQQTMIQFARQAATATQDMAVQQSRAAFKKGSKVVIQRGIRFLLQGIMVAVDVGTAGVGILVTIIFQLVDLAWLNVEMVYGYYFAKGKSRIISPLDWTPLPIPLHPIFLHILVIFADIAVFTIGTVFFLLGIMIVVAFVTVIATAALGPLAWIYLVVTHAGTIVDLIKLFL